MTYNRIIEAVVSIVILLFSVTVHEFMHGWVAYRCGDDTARLNNRLTLNPLYHIDPVWTIIMPIMFYIYLGFPFGGAKPVPVNPYNFRRLRRDYVLVSAAGPLSNLGLAAVGVAVLPFLSHLAAGVAAPLHRLLETMIVINIVLVAFNLIPVPPLDGSKIVMGILPDRLSRAYERLEPYGMIILFVLLVSGAIDYLFYPIYAAVHSLLTVVYKLAGGF